MTLVTIRLGFFTKNSPLLVVIEVRLLFLRGMEADELSALGDLGRTRPQGDHFNHLLADLNHTLTDSRSFYASMNTSLSGA